MRSNQTRLLSLIAIALLCAAYLIPTAGASPEKGALAWRVLRLGDRREVFTPSDEPVLPLVHAKEDEERVYRICAMVEGDGELLINYGDVGDGVEFHNAVPMPACAYAWVGSGGSGAHPNPLDVYLFQRGKRPALMTKAEIKVGVLAQD